MKRAWFAFVTFIAAVTTSVKADCANSGLGSCVWNGITYQNGEVFTREGLSKCFKYKCEERHIDLYESGCEMDEKCHKVGSNYTKNCVTYKCKTSRNNGVTTYKMDLEEYQCRISGVCRELGVPFDHGCASYVCNEKVENGKSQYKVEIAGVRCKDKFGGCHDVGEAFTLDIQGKEYQKCKCTVNEEWHLKYTCYA